MSAFARDLARLDRAVRRLEGNPSSAPSSRAISRWYDQQPDGDYTCADCGKVGPKHYVQPQHPFYAEGRKDVARCSDCINQRNADARARNKAARAEERAGAAARQHEALAALGSRYPDGRSIPREGDEVYTYTAGFGGMAAVVRGVVVRRRGALAVRAAEVSSMLGGTVGLARARIYDLSRDWTVRGEQHPHDIAQDHAEREAKERQSAHEREDAALAERIKASKSSGARHLDDAGPEIVGRRVRSLRSDYQTTISEWHPEYGPLTEDGATMGNKRSLAEWVVLR